MTAAHHGDMLMAADSRTDSLPWFRSLCTVRWRGLAFWLPTQASVAAIPGHRSDGVRNAWERPLTVHSVQLDGMARRLGPLALVTSLLLSTLGCTSEGRSVGLGDPLAAGTDASISAPETSAQLPPLALDRVASSSAQGTAAPVPRKQIVSLGTLASVVPVPQLPQTLGPTRPDARLQELVSAALEGEEGTYSVVVRNLVDGRYAAVNPAHVHYAASLFKLAVLAAAYRERDAGRLDFQRLLVLEDRYVEHDLGTLELLGLEPRDQVSVADAIKAMIVVSDTPLALMVQDAVGAARVEALLRDESLEDSSIMTEGLPTTATDMARVLEAIATGKDFTEASREEMLSLLLQERIRSGIVAGVPEGTAVAHKTGVWSDATHDVGIVWGPGGPYLLAILSNRAWGWEPVVRLSQMVYQHLAATTALAGRRRPLSPDSQWSHEPLGRPRRSWEQLFR